MKPKKYNPAPEEIEILRSNYDGTSLALNRIMRLTGRKYPRWYVRRMAAGMGLARIKEPDWTVAEEAYLAENGQRIGLKYLRMGLIRNGWFPRSHTAIKLKLKRMGILSGMGDGFTLCGLCNLLWGGQEQHHIISRWMNNGWLRGKRRGTLRKACQGGDEWRFEPEWVRAFIIAHPEEIDLRLVDPVAFIRLVAGDNLEMPVHCKCPTCGVEFERRMFNPGLRLMRVYCDNCRLRHEDIDARTYAIAVTG